MDECMYVCLCNTNGENMVRFSSTMLEFIVTTPFGKDYGLICNRHKGSTKFPKSNPLRILLDTEKTPGPTTFVGKSRSSVVSRVD
jgi:hypothetical protein